MTLITTKAWRERRLTQDADWVPRGVRIRAFNVPYCNDMSTPERAAAFVRYALQAVWEGGRIPRPSLVYGSSTPLTVAGAAAAVAHVQECPWIFEVRDLWPDFPIQMGAITTEWVQRALRRLERWLYQDAAHVVTVSPDMERHVRQFVAPAHVSTVEYGTDLTLLDRITENDVQALRQQHELEKHRVILYAGSFGRANDIPTLLEAARRLQHRRDVCFVFAGAGYYEGAIHESAARNPIVKKIAPQPYHRALALFKAASLSLVPFINLPVLRANAPSKLFDSLAAGTPAVVTNSGWTKDLVEQHQCGWYVPASQPRTLADKIEHLLDHPDELRTAGRRGAALARKRFNRSVHMNRLAELIGNVAARAAA